MNPADPWATVAAVVGVALLTIAAILVAVIAVAERRHGRDADPAPPPEFAEWDHQNHRPPPATPPTVNETRVLPYVAPVRGNPDLSASSPGWATVDSLAAPRGRPSLLRYPWPPNFTRTPDGLLCDCGQMIPPRPGLTPAARIADHRRDHLRRMGW